MENAKIAKLKRDILSNFQTLCVSCLSYLEDPFFFYHVKRTVWKYLHSFFDMFFFYLFFFGKKPKSFFPLQWLWVKEKESEFWSLWSLIGNCRDLYRWLHVDIIWRSLMTISVFCVFSSSNIAIWLVKMRPFFEVFQTLCSLSLNYKRATLGVLSGIYQG